MGAGSETLTAVKKLQFEIEIGGDSNKREIWH